MSMWYTFIMNAFFGKKRENKELEMNDKEDMLSNYIELDSNHLSSKGNWDRQLNWPVPVFSVNISVAYIYFRTHNRIWISLNVVSGKAGTSMIQIIF